MAQSTATLALARYFTEEGVDPYNTLNWVRRDSAIINPGTGKPVFEQKQVEFPDTWSLNAINVVSQKYFHGTPGADDRENSLKQLINRVADTITKYGYEQGYFTDESEADTFNAELKYILATQRAAFNSPVWFNIGTPDRSQQASACFILKVDDTMPSILNWYREEGMIFKGGSGAGLNISTIRSSYEPLSSSGGKASGPLSFMRGADSSAGAIKSGGKTRRAAKMVILNVDHPDIEDFIESKAREERKARALYDAGFDIALNGKDSTSLQYQNANNSVRVTDEFMHAVEADADWNLVGVKDKKIYKTIKARQLFRDIAQASWECADPGMQFDTVINDWHTTPKAGRIEGSNPCSEYMHLNNSACNLSSINLLKFLKDDDTYDIPAYKHAIEVMFLAQEILVGYSEYPTEAIDKTARAYRQLGLGYANLGALLMAQGLAYDSQEGRAQAAALTSILTGHAYATSAKIAKRVGAFDGYAKDSEGVNRVLRKHRDAVRDIDAGMVAEDLLSAAATSWDEAVELGQKYGIRNAQATLLAPTGTIGFMMDCDTTGIEPDFALTKFKTLVGGGSMIIVNQTIPRALKRLGYSKKQSQEIIDYIHLNSSVIGAPHLRSEHLPVFATATGDNAIHYLGHVKMMAAVQPFLSGAISKTVNMPEDVTVEDVEQLHMDSWKMGIKAIAIYRDNCKTFQPLSSKKEEDKKAVAPAIAAAEPVVVRAAMKRELPRVRASKTFEFHVADLKGFATVGEYADGTPGELFVRVAKQGSTLSGIMDSFAISVSHGLQYGVPLKSYVKTLINMTYAPSGLTDDPEIRNAASLTDYIFRRLAKQYLSFDDQLELGLMSFEELEAQTQAKQPSLLTGEEVSDAPRQDTEAVEVAAKPVVAASTQPLAAAQVNLFTATAAAGGEVSKAKRYSTESTAPLCTNCGNQTQRAGSCYVCQGCGSTSGCS